MAKIIDIRICPRCDNKYTWDYIIPNDSYEYDEYESEIVDTNNAHAHMSGLNKSEYISFSTICPYCRQFDTFDYKNPKIYK